MHDVCGGFVCIMCVWGTCMHDACGGLVCMMCIGDLYAQCVWGTCMHDMCRTCMMCAHQRCVVRLKLQCVYFLENLGEFRKCTLSLVAIYVFFHLFPCFFIVDPDRSAVTPTQTKVSRSDMISDLRVLLTCFSSSFC